MVVKHIYVLEFKTIITKALRSVGLQEIFIFRLCPEKIVANSSPEYVLNFNSKICFRYILSHLEECVLDNLSQLEVYRILC